MQPSAWTPEHLAVLDLAAAARGRVITASDVAPIVPGLDLWDMWPLAQPGGATASVAGGTLWFVLSAPVLPNPVDRHFQARIRMLHEVGGAWRDCGHAMPDGFSPGSREWAGSAVLGPGAGEVTLFFTAAGRRGERTPTVEQRLFQTTGRLAEAGSVPSIRDWSPPLESVASDGDIYVRANQVEGPPGKLKAFRDPAFFRDPADGRSYLLFAASLKGSPHAENGAVGLARARDALLREWELLPPLLVADGVNNELERPHVVVRDGLYHLFWSTQTHTFAASVRAGPNGLYGMVAPAFGGPYAPLNGSGLVLANPEAEPTQAYSWWVTGEGEVASFVDYWGMSGRKLADHPELVRSQFGGVPAPRVGLPEGRQGK